MEYTVVPRNDSVVHTFHYYHEIEFQIVYRQSEEGKTYPMNLLLPPPRLLYL